MRACVTARAGRGVVTRAGATTEGAEEKSGERKRSENSCESHLLIVAGEAIRGSKTIHAERVQPPRDVTTEHMRREPAPSRGERWLSRLGAAARTELFVLRT